MINDGIHVIWVIVMLKPFQLFIALCLMQMGNEIGNAGIEQFHPAQAFDIGGNHKRVHTLYLAADFHKLCHLAGQFRDAFVDKVNAMLDLIGKASFSESFQSCIGHRLLVKGLCMEGSLITDIEQQRFKEFIIRLVAELF